MAATCPNCKGALDRSHDCLTREKPAIEHAELEISFGGEVAVFVPKPALHRTQRALTQVKRALAMASATANVWQGLCARAWARGDEHERLLHDSGMVAVPVVTVAPKLIDGDGPMCSRDACPAFVAGRCEMSGRDIYAADGDVPCDVAT